MKLKPVRIEENPAMKMPRPVITTCVFETAVLYGV